MKDTGAEANCLLKPQDFSKRCTVESLDSGTGTSDLGRGISTVSTDCSVCSSLRVSSVILSFFSGLSVFSTGTNASMGHAHMDKSGTGHKPPAGSILSLSAGSHLSLSPGSSPGTANDFAAFQASELPRVSVPHPLPARRNVRSDGKLHRVDGSDRVGDCERFRCFPSTRNPSRHCPHPPSLRPHAQRTKRHEQLAPRSQSPNTHR